MKLGLFADPAGWHAADLARAAGARHQLSWHRVEELHAGLAIGSRLSTVGCGGTALDSLDAVFLRTIPGGSLDQIVFRMDALGELERNGVCVVNPARTVEACVDKYLALCRLARAGIPVPETRVCQRSEDALRAFDEFGGCAVLKPVFGSEGRGILLLDHRDLAARAFDLLAAHQQSIYLQRRIDHGNRDIRLFMAGRELRAMVRTNPSDWRVNAARGGATAPHEPTPLERELAERICDSLGTIVAGIDLVYDPSGNPLVLEVNSAPGWKHLSETLQVDIASLVLRAIEKAQE